MEITPLDIYILSLLDPIRGALEASAVFCVCMAGLAGFAILAGDHDEGGKRIFVKWFLIGIFSSLVFLTGKILIPSQKTVAAMILIPAAINNVEIQSISKGALQWADQYIQKQLKKE